MAFFSKYPKGNSYIPILSWSIDLSFRKKYALANNYYNVNLVFMIDSGSTLQLKAAKKQFVTMISSMLQKLKL